MNREKLLKAMDKLTEVVGTLRGPSGCPWDAEQTDATIMMYLLEEAYEVLDAVERGGPGEVCGELGDVLFQIIFMARLAEEREEFDLVDVLEKIAEKMIRRHPHVFGPKRLTTPEEVIQNWFRVKGDEEGISRTPSSDLQSIPRSLPALLWAHRMIERAALMVGGQARDMKKTWGKMEEIFDEMGKNVALENKERVGEVLGQFLFLLVDLAQGFGLNTEHLLREANQTFLRKFTYEGAASPQARHDKGGSHG